MKVRHYFFLGLGITLGGLLSGCATSNFALHIPASDSPVRSFPSPPPTVIRLPVRITFPKIGDIPKDLPLWLDQQVQRVDAALHRGVGDLKWPPSIFRGFAELEDIPKLWEGVQEPIFIDKDIWLLIHPESLSSGWALADPKNPFNWNVVLEMTAHPQLVFGPEPSVLLKKLPPFGFYKPGPRGFHAVGNTSISFQEADRILADPKSGLVDYPVKGSGGYRLKIKGVKLYGAQGQVIAQTLIEYYPLINLGGNASQMTIYFRGHPSFDPRTETFYLKDLDFDVRTGDFLMQVASWILKSDILTALRKKAHIPVGGKLKQLRERMNIVLNRAVGRHTRLETHVESFRIMDAFVDQGGIQAQMSLDGTAQLHLMSPGAR